MFIENSENLDQSDMISDRFTSFPLLGFNQRRPTQTDLAKERLQREPYDDCIVLFRSMTREHSPADKL